MTFEIGAMVYDYGRNKIGYISKRLLAQDSRTCYYRVEWITSEKAWNDNIWLNDIVIESFISNFETTYNKEKNNVHNSKTRTRK